MLFVVRDAALIAAPSAAVGVIVAVSDLQPDEQTMRAVGELLASVGLVIAGWLYARRAQSASPVGLIGFLALPHTARYTALLALVLSIFSAALAIASGADVSTFSRAPIWAAALLTLIAVGMNWAKVIVSMAIGAWFGSRWRRSRANS